MLTHRVVDGKSQSGIMWIRDGGFGNEIADGAEGVEALGNGPGKTGAFGGFLDVAGGHVDGDDVACGRGEEVQLLR